jgi:hypothetical protein
MDRLIFGIRTHSADHIIPELQTLSPGDRVPDSSDAVVAYFEVAKVETNQTLVLISHTHPLPIYRDVTFFILEDLGADTRLIIRARISYAPVGSALLVPLLMVIGFGIGDIVQAGAMLAAIKTRAESLARLPRLREPADSGRARQTWRAPITETRLDVL